MKLYFITSVRWEKKIWPEGTKNYKDEDISGQKYEIPDKRCWGFYLSKKTAFQAVEENWTDLNECGYYPWVVVEEYEEGLLQLPCKSYWFEQDLDKKQVENLIKDKTEEELEALNIRCTDEGYFTWNDGVTEEGIKCITSNFKGYKRTKKPSWSSNTGWGLG